MKKVLAIIAAIMLAAIVLLPATAYTISSGANQSYSLQSTPVNYSIRAGAPASNITPGSIPGAVSPASAVTVTQVPYSFKIGAAAPYSVKLASGVNVTPEGILTKPQTELLGSLAKNATSSAPATQPAPATQAPSPAPQNVSAPAPKPAPAPAKFSIMGMVLDDTSKMGLAGWIVNLEQPAGKVIANATTNGSGSYSFNSLNPGAYVVAEVLPTGWAAVTPADGKQTVNLTKDVTGLNFANKKMPAENVTVPSNETAPAVAPVVTPPVAPTTNATQLNTTQLNSTAKK